MFADDKFAMKRWTFSNLTKSQNLNISVPDGAVFENFKLGNSLFPVKFQAITYDDHVR